MGELETIPDVHQSTLSQQIGELRKARHADDESCHLSAGASANWSNDRTPRLLFVDLDASAMWKGAQFGIAISAETG